MFCPRCGTYNEDSHSFCLKCGSPLKASQSGGAAPQPQPQPQQQYQPQQQFQQPQLQTQYAQGCFGAAWQDVTASEGWIGRMFLLGLIGLVPILNFVVVGYAANWARGLYLGRNESLPKDIISENNFMLGLYLIIFTLVGAFVGGVISGILSLVLFWLPIIGQLIVAAFDILFFMFIAACSMRIVISGDLASGFSLDKVWPLYKANMGTLFGAYCLPSIVIGIIAGAIVTILALIFSAITGVAIFSASTGTDVGNAAAGAGSVTGVFLILVIVYLTLVATALLAVVTDRSMGHWVTRYAQVWKGEPGFIPFGFGGYAPVPNPAPAPTYAPGSVPGSVSAQAPAPVPDLVPVQASVPTPAPAQAQAPTATPESGPVTSADESDKPAAN